MPMASVWLRLLGAVLCAAFLAAESPKTKGKGKGKAKPAAPKDASPAPAEDEFVPGPKDGGEAKPPAASEPPAPPDPAAVQKEIEAAEGAALAKIEALGAPGSAAAIAGRLQASLGPLRKKAYLAIYKDPNPANFYATKDPIKDGYGDSTASEVAALSKEIFGILKDGILRDAEAKRVFDEGVAAFRAQAKRRVEEGLPGPAMGPDDALDYSRQRVSDAMIPPADKAVIQQNEAVAGALEPVERAANREYNLYRVSMGFKACRLDLRLYKAANSHSEEMARLGYYSHTSPTKGRKEPSDRTALAGFPGTPINECIMAGGAGVQNDPTAPILGWIGSPPHHKLMLATVECFGLGKAVSDAGAKNLASKGSSPSKGAGKFSLYWTLVNGSLGGAKPATPAPGTKPSGPAKKKKK